MQGKLFVDGGARGNPGPAGVGIIIEGPKNIQEKQFIGNTTNNVAEYHALILGLKIALDNKYNKLDIFGDSELIVKQIRGEYKVKKEELKPYYLEAQKYLQQLKNYTITHIKRELNDKADKLVNEAIDNENL